MTKTYLTTIILTILTLTFAASGEAFAAKNYRLVKTANDAKVYLVKNNRRIHIPNPSVFEAGGYKWGEIELNHYLNNPMMNFFTINTF